MGEPLSLIGFGPSVYTRIVRMALNEMGLTAAYVEADPFAAAPDPVLAEATPLGRVPVLRHGDFTLTETVAILRYLDALSDHPSLIPQEPQAAARMAQVMGIVDGHAYWPMVRDVFSHGYFRPLIGAAADPERVTAGLVASAPVLEALERIAVEGQQLAGAEISLADLHLAPMIAYFTLVPEGRDALRAKPALWRWWDRLRQQPSLIATDPFAAR